MSQRTVIRETANFTLYERGNRYYLRAKSNRLQPRGRRIKPADVGYLTWLSDDGFDGAAVWDYGIGAFQRTA